MAKVQIVFSCDENYFLLAKGLVLSIQAAGPLPADCELGFVDLGCMPGQLDWLRGQGVFVVPFDAELIGPLARLVSGPQRALILRRPFLPRMFPAAEAIVWLDSDLWIQMPDVLQVFSALRDRIRKSSLSARNGTSATSGSIRASRCTRPITPPASTLRYTARKSRPK